MRRSGCALTAFLAQCLVATCFMPPAPPGTSGPSCRAVRLSAKTPVLHGEKTVIEVPASQSRRQFFGLSTAFGAAVFFQRKAEAAVSSNPLCDDAVSHLRDEKTGQDVYLIGTAHISNVSAVLVADIIRSVRPDTVMLELDESRVKRIAKVPPPPQAAGSAADGGDGGETAILPPPGAGRQERRRQPALDGPPLWRRLLDFGRPLDEKVTDVGAAAAGTVIGNLYKNLDSKGFASGDEFAVAAREAQRLGARIVLGDRAVSVTLRRLAEALRKTPLDSFQALNDALSGAVSAPDDLDAAGLAVWVERLKQRKVVRATMAVVKENVPEVYAAMVGERDEFMANSIRQSGGTRVVAVVGMAHLDGLERNLGYKQLACRLW